MAIEFKDSPDASAYFAPQLNRPDIELPKKIYTQIDIWEAQQHVVRDLRRFYSGIGIIDTDMFADKPEKEFYRHSPHHGVFLIDQESQDYQAFLEQCRIETQELNHKLDTLFKERKIPITCKRNPSGTREDMIRLWISIDPPFLATHRDIHGKETRSRALSEKGIFYHIHQDHVHTIHGIRTHRPQRDGHRFEDLRGVIGEKLVSYREGTFFKENSADLGAIAEDLLTVIESYFQEIDTDDVESRTGTLNESGRKIITTLAQLKDEWTRDLEGNSLYSQKYALHMLLTHFVGLSGNNDIEIRRGNAQEKKLIADVVTLAHDPDVSWHLDIQITEQMVKNMLVGIYKS